MLVLLELAIGAVVIVFWFTQIVWPIVAGKPILPILKFRRQRQVLNNVQEDIERATLEEQAETLRQQVLGGKRRSAVYEPDGEKNA